MFRLIKLIIEILIIAAIVFWFIQNPGTIQINWLGYATETRVDIAVLILFVFIFIIVILHGIYRKIVTFPEKWKEAQKKKQMYHALDLILENFEARAAKNIKKTLNTMKSLEKLFPEHKLIEKIKGISFLEEGRDKKALRIFEKLSHSPQTKFLGLKYLVEYYLKNGSDEQVLTTLREIFYTCPHQTEFHRLLLRYEIKDQSWKNAITVIMSMMKHREITAVDFRRLKGSVLFFWGKSEYENQKDLDHLKLVEEAYELRPGFSPIACFLAYAYLENNQSDQAKAVIERSWRTMPHIDLVTCYREIHKEQSVMEWIKTIEKLHALNPDSLMSHFYMLQACFDAELWGQVKSHLEIILKKEPHEGALFYYNQLKTLKPEIAASLDKFISTDIDPKSFPAWQCKECGVLQQEWEFFCTSCHEMNSLLWGLPKKIVPRIS